MQENASICSHFPQDLQTTKMRFLIVLVVSLTIVAMSVAKQSKKSRNHKRQAGKIFQVEKFALQIWNLVTFGPNFTPCAFINQRFSLSIYTVIKLVRRSGLGVVSWTCDPVLALGQRFDSHSRRLFCCNPLG